MVSLSNRERTWAFSLVLALFFLALHLPYLPKSLEDLEAHLASSIDYSVASAIMLKSTTMERSRRMSQAMR